MPKCKQGNTTTNKMDIYLCKYCGQTLSNLDTFRRHLKVIHYSKTRVHSCSICGLKTRRFDSMRRHLKTNKHCEKASSITNYILDFLDPPKAKAIERSSYKADPSTTNSYLYQQTMPKNKEMFPWVLQALETTPPDPERIYRPQYLLTKDTLPIPLESKETLRDPRIERESTSPSWVDSSELSELDLMLRSKLEELSSPKEKPLPYNGLH